MKTVPYRDVAKFGVVTDVDPYQLPMGAWSWGQNVRFRNTTITRAPVFRAVKQSLLNTGPRFLGAIFPSSGFDSIVIGYQNGRVTLLEAGTEADASITSYSNNIAETPFTDCILGDVYYINRNDRAPWALLPTSSTFEVLPNWAPVSSPWTCNILRALNNALIAFGITQSGTEFPTMVITSEFAINGAVPTTWNYTLGTNNATQNTLDQMKGSIVDAAPLGQEMMIYSQTETWRMFLTGDDNVWGYVPLFSDQGAINANCSIEVDKKHYVFGLNDLWVHDGNSKESICDQKTREFIFGGLDVTNASRCAVSYNNNLKELYFRYMSKDAFVKFSGADGCNRQAVFHIPTGTWTFDDLPFVFGAAMANVDITRTWATDSLIWSTSGGTWASLADSAKRVMTMLGDSNSGYSVSEQVYAFDLQGPGSLVSFAVDTHATQGWTLIRDGIDLEVLGADLVGYKVISSIVPQARTELGAQPISVSVATADVYPAEPAPGDYITQTYDLFNRKLDFNAAGRYASVTITHNDYHWVSFTGVDLVLDVLAEF